MAGKVNVVLHYQGGGSDKVYVSSIKSVAGSFQVVCKWGRRGGTMQVQTKGTYSAFDVAVATRNSILSEKLSKGYKNIEGPGYSGPLQMTTPWLVRYL